MDDMEQRLRAATETCVSCHAVWRTDTKETAARGSLMEAVHELRKIAARLEIEIAVSERDEMAAKPIPIPPHRSSRKGGEHGGDDNIGNMAEMDDPNDRQPSHNRSGGFRGPPSGGQGGGNNRPSGGGPGGQGGGPRRRMGMGGPQGGGSQGGGNSRPPSPPPSSDDQG